MEFLNQGLSFGSQRKRYPQGTPFSFQPVGTPQLVFGDDFLHRLDFPHLLK